MESNLNYVGLAGADGTITPISPGLKPVGNSGIETGNIIIKQPTGGYEIRTGNKKHWSEIVGDVTSYVLKLGLTASQIISAVKGSQPIIIANPETGKSIDVSSKLREEYNRRGEDEYYNRLLENQNSNNNQNNNSNKKDNTLLYVGIGFGALILVGALAFALKK